MLERIPRHAINNEGRWPILDTRGVTGPAERNSRQLLRGGLMSIHKSARKRFSGDGVKVIPTRRDSALTICSKGS
ncbi:MAG: hypothetical protein ACREYE_26630 [Gammaproteobacteria bacterium]